MMWLVPTIAPRSAVMVLVTSVSRVIVRSRRPSFHFFRLPTMQSQEHRPRAWNICS